MSVPVMNVSTKSCMVNQAITMGVIRGNSDELNDCDQFDTMSHS